MCRLKIFILQVLVLFSCHAFGQSVTHKQADSLINSLNSDNAGTLHIVTFLQLARFNIAKPGRRKLDLDSAASFIEAANKLNGIVNSPLYEGNIALLQAYVLKKRNGFLVNEELLEKSTKSLGMTNDKYHLAMAWAELLNYYAFQRGNPKEVALIKEKLTVILDDSAKPPSSLLTLNERKDILMAARYMDAGWPIGLLNDLVLRSQKVNDHGIEIWARKEIADMYVRQGKNQMAEMQLLKLLSDYQQTGFEHICNTYDLLAGVYVNQYNYNRALYYAFEALKSAGTDDSSSIIGFYFRIYTIYTCLDKTKECIEWLNKIISYDISNEDISGMYPVLRRLAKFLIREGKTQEALDFILGIEKKFPPVSLRDREEVFFAIAKCYAALNNNMLAEKYFEEAVRLDNIQMKAGRNETYAPLDHDFGNFCVSIGKYRKAEYYLKKALAETPYEVKYNYRNAYIGLFKVDSASGRYLSAIQYLKTFQNLNDSVFNITRNKQIEELEIAYNTEQKDKDITILQKKSNLEAIKLKFAEDTRNRIIAGAVMLTLLLAVSYNRFLLKKRSNRKLQSQQQELNVLVKEKDVLLFQKDHLLTEKEWLLKEVHHRVKNNLHTVICLLESQAAYLENDALKAIQNSQHRIYAMSLIHQKLYQSDDVKTIDMAIYLPEFIGYLNDSFNTYGQIRFNLAIDPIKLDISQAIPLALIINEAVTNSIKYAFSGKNTGLVRIALYRSGTRTVLEIVDDGIGLPPDIFQKQLNSLGFRLMSGLSEEINALISFKNENGAKIIITIDDPEFNMIAIPAADNKDVQV